MLIEVKNLIKEEKDYYLKEDGFINIEVKGNLILIKEK